MARTKYGQKPRISPNFADVAVTDLPPGSRDLTAAELAAFGPKLATDEGMADFLTATFGTAGWTYDRGEDVWIAPDRRYRGEGRRFWVIRRGGNWRWAVLRPGVLQ